MASAELAVEACDDLIERAEWEEIEGVIEDGIWPARPASPDAAAKTLTTAMGRRIYGSRHESFLCAAGFCEKLRARHLRHGAPFPCGAHQARASAPRDDRVRREGFGAFGAGCSAGVPRYAFNSRR